MGLGFGLYYLDFAISKFWVFKKNYVMSRSTCSVRSEVAWESCILGSNLSCHTAHRGINMNEELEIKSLNIIDI